VLIWSALACTVLARSLTQLDTAVSDMRNWRCVSGTYWAKCSLNVMARAFHITEAAKYNLEPSLTAQSQSSVSPLSDPGIAAH
jgi:hypothetical protein